MLLRAPGPERVKLILSVLSAHPQYAGLESLREVLVSETAAPEARLRAACALVSLEPGGCPEMNRSALLWRGRSSKRAGGPFPTG